MTYWQVYINLRQWTGRMIKKSIIVLLFFCLLIIGVVQEVKSASLIMQPTVNEIQVSSKDMRCDYSYEDIRKLSSNFKYPKLIIIDNQSPIVAFIDEQGKELIFAKVSEGGVNYLKKIPKFSEQYGWQSWPVIFVKGDKIYIAIKKENKWYEKPGIRIFLFDKNTSALSLQEDIALVHESAAFSSKDIYSSDNGYFIVGEGEKSCLSDLGTFFAYGHVVTYHKQYSMLWDGKTVHEKQIVDEGCFSAKSPVYAVSDSGILQSVWIRNTTRQSISLRYDDSICYAENKSGEEWSKPINVYPSENTNKARYIKDLSIANYKQSVFILWCDVQKGYFFAEIKNGALIEVKQILDIKNLSDFPLPGSMETEITTDDNGNIYCLMSVQYGQRWDECKLILKSRINGKWLDDILISDEVIRAPDIKVDKKGVIHIAYVKYPKGHKKEKLTMAEIKQEVEKLSKAACYYVKINLKENN
jgi:hypothetical protein